MNAPVTRESIVDSCLLILHDWSGFITLADTAIEKERGVIREEWRTRQDAQARIWDQQAGVDNALASDRSVHDHVDRFVETCISVEVLTSAHPDAFGKFIHAMPWEVLYRPECRIDPGRREPARTGPFP